MMAWRRLGAKPLSDAMLTRFTDTALGGDELLIDADVLARR